MAQETELKELICTTYGHKVSGGMLEGWGMQYGEGMEGGNLGKP